MKNILWWVSDFLERKPHKYIMNKRKKNEYEKNKTTCPFSFITDGFKIVFGVARRDHLEISLFYIQGLIASNMSTFFFGPFFCRLFFDRNRIFYIPKLP